MPHRRGKPGAAESWETSPDGRTWTFKVRDATWRKGPDASFAEAGKVKASDFVYAWKRLFDKDLRSPHAHVLDVLTGVSPLSTEKPRYEALDRIVGDLDAAVGKQKRTLTGEQVINFLNDTERNARRWLGEIAAPEAREILAWKEKDPYQAARAAKLIAALSAERDRLIKVVTVDADLGHRHDLHFFPALRPNQHHRPIARHTGLGLNRVHYDHSRVRGLSPTATGALACSASLARQRAISSPHPSVRRRRLSADMLPPTASRYPYAAKRLFLK